MVYESFMLFATKFIICVTAFIVVFTNVFGTKCVIDWLKDKEKDKVDIALAIIMSFSILLLDSVCVVGVIASVIPK